MAGRNNRWESFAKEDAEYYILTDPSADHHTPEGREKFFESGEKATEAQTGRVMDLLPARSVAVEIGSGIGRLAFPNAALFGRVRAMDVSPTMLRRLREEAARRGIGNVETFEPQERWDAPGVDYVYSSHVFQHIADEAVIEEYIGRISAALKPGGIAQLHFDTRRETLAYHVRNVLPDWLLPRPWRKSIRRIRRDPAFLRALFAASGLDVVRELGPASDEHVFVLRRAA